MEEATKTIEALVKNVLPPKAHYLSSSEYPTRRFPPPVDDKRLEEQDTRQLQYTTFVGDADRGVLLTRAYFDVRQDPVDSTNAIIAPIIRKSDPNKPKTKLSLKDYKNRKKTPEGDEPPKPTPRPPKVNAPAKKLSDQVAKDMEGRRDPKKEISDAKSDHKPEARRHRSPSPERRKRVIEADHDPKPVKRTKIENATPNSISSRPVKGSGNTPQKSERQVTSEKKLPKEAKALPTTNGKSALNSAGNKGVSPRPSAQMNGSQKLNRSKDGADKKTESNPKPKMPPLLSPIDMSDYMDDDTKAPRPSPKKKPMDSNTLKPPPKKNRDDREPSPSSKKRRVIPPLLSPTLPPIVMEELAKSNKSTSSKDSSQRSGQIPDSPPDQKKATKSLKREETTIHVDSNKGQKEQKEQKESLMVTMKYKKRNAKTIERLLALPPGGKKKSDLLRKDDRATRDRSDSLEPSTARKRPIPVTEASEPSKRPKTSEAIRPSTPPRQSSTMTRVASSSSQAGTPGVANGLTPAAQPPERRRPPVDTEKLHRLQQKAGTFIQLGTKLKHERDGVLKRPSEGISERDRQVAIAAGIQCLVSFLLGFKLQSDASDLERKPCSTRSFRDTLALFRVSRTDCARHSQLTALVLRLQGVCLGYISRILCSYSPDPEFAKEIIANSKDQQEIWRLSENARKVMGVYDGSSKSDDGGPIGKLIDRIGPWSTAEEAIPITLEVLRKVMLANHSWKPSDALSKVGHTMTNGVIN
ncbi:hypothetical protein F4819DRAFT_191992 [Hypoxylon fuscum]|nr:hypothetical protein F4819DRAFT_191992 [Hypoxylon fuscum]